MKRSRPILGAALALAAALAGAGCGWGRADAARPSPELLARGEEIYRVYCAVCHQADGGGVPGMQPPLSGAETLADDERLALWLLRGSESPQRPAGEWANVMPPFSALDDDDLAAVASYVRNAFGNEGPPLSPLTVREVRESLVRPQRDGVR